MSFAPAPTQAMANIQAANQRRKLLAQRLAQQMAAKAALSGRAGLGRIQASGRSFGNSVDLRAAATPILGLPFALPDGRARPAGYDASAPESPSVLPPAGGGIGVGGAPDPGPPPVPPAGSGVGVGAGHVGGTPQYHGGSLSGLPGSGSGGGPLINQLPSDYTGFNSDTPLSAAAPPDPYSIMMQRIAMLQASRGGVQY